MSHWNAGYVTEINYTSQYFPYLSPAHLRFAMLCSELEMPPQDADFCYLEVGFGQGVSLAAHAATNPGDFWGMDFIPSQTGFCRDLLRGTGVDAKILNDSFEEFLARRDVPDFDVIGIHGILSWVSADNRAAIMKIISRHLKPGGIVYASYNTYPGWSSMAPVREYMMETHRRRGGPVVGGMQAGLDQMRRMLEVGSPFLKANPVIEQRLKEMAEQDPSYLAHEYLNEAWKTFYFPEMAKMMEAERLKFAASAHLLDHFDRLNMSGDAVKMLTDAPDPVLREMTRDMLRNTMFRRDIFVKGRRKITPLRLRRLLDDQSFVFQKMPATMPDSFDAPVGTVNLDSPVYELLKAELARDNMAAKPFGDLAAAAAKAKIPRQQVFEAVRILVAINRIRPTQPTDVVQKALKTARAFNTNVTNMAADSTAVDIVASPLTGTAIRLGNLNMQQLHAHLSKSKSTEEDLWNTLQLKGEQLMHNGQPVEGKEAHIKLLQDGTRQFNENLLPLLKTLKIA